MRLCNHNGKIRPVVGNPLKGSETSSLLFSSSTITPSSRLTTFSLGNLIYNDQSIEPHSCLSARADRGRRRNGRIGKQLVLVPNHRHHPRWRFRDGSTTHPAAAHRSKEGSQSARVSGDDGGVCADRNLPLFPPPISPLFSPPHIPRSG